MTDRKIIIVTGERDWTARGAIELAIIRATLGFNTVHLFHGAASGADGIAEYVAGNMGFQVHSYPVTPEDWSTLGPAAGPIRNGQMLKAALLESEELSADIECLAFWSGKTKRSGTLDCMSQATALGIPVRVVPRATR